ncbi:MAG: hypothetical protein RLZZ156_2795 [Deinococcota bacterium]|jgi:hypothetical protein
METLRLVFRFVHFLAWAALLGGLLTQYSSQQKTVPKVALWGARIAFLAGIVLVGIKEMVANQTGVEVNHIKVGIKLLLGLVAVALLEISNRRGLTKPMFHAAFGASVTAVGVAVFWV